MQDSSSARLGTIDSSRDCNHIYQHVIQNLCKLNMDSNIASDPSLRKRNSPCKHCRQQRRKCIREDGPCSRCQQMQLVCVNDNVLNASAMIEEIEQEEEMEEKSRMVGKVAEIQRQLAELGDQLEMMKTALDVPALEGSSDSPEKDGPGSPLINSSNTANTVQTEVSSPLSFSTDITSIDPVRHAAKYRPPTSWTSQASDMDILRRLDWKLTLRSDGMLRIHTSIRSFQDLIDFGVLNNDHMHPDDPSNPLSLAYLRRSGHRTMRVTMTGRLREASDVWGASRADAADGSRLRVGVEPLRQLF
ncbi:hypothetical protein BC936DRAFT_147995 [Jimgerdemannia flammicorona]|uniref:Zn(2)-C6 fungal-type domain-containing protein n=1 Tax=Jimgerdemannia flammicorona TaxID=994334 RepID=A0A433D404_9FUNG|nr:hypothetical protein BC936DRAFT_147995 [Jimgerdemannia flammicorona]